MRRLTKLSQDESNGPSGGFTVDDSMGTQIDYVKLSNVLGLHRSSFNLIQGTAQKNKLNDETARMLVRQLARKKKSPTAADSTRGQSPEPLMQQNPRTLSKGALAPVRASGGSMQNRSVQ